MRSPASFVHVRAKFVMSGLDALKFRVGAWISWNLLVKPHSIQAKAHFHFALQSPLHPEKLYCSYQWLFIQLIEVLKLMISLKCKDQHLLPALQLCSIVFPVCSFYAIDITKTAIFPVCSFYSIDITKTTGPVYFFFFLSSIHIMFGFWICGGISKEKNLKW